MTRRQVEQVGLTQGRDEQLIYTLTTTPWGSDPSNVVLTLYDVTDDDNWIDVSSTLLSGSATVSGDVITLEKMLSTVGDHDYRLEIKFTSGGNVFEPFALIKGKK